MAPSKSVTLGDPCSRCRPPNILPSTALARSEPFCTKCFARFLSTKLRKQIPDYKVAYTRDKKVIPTRHHAVVPVFYRGETSTQSSVVREWIWQDNTETAAAVVLVDLLAELIREQRQKHAKNQGFVLHILVVRPTTTTTTEETCRITEFFKQHYTQETASIEELGLDTFAGDVLDALPSRASRADALGLISRRAIAQYLNKLAADHAADNWQVAELAAEPVEGVAQRVLASVAKGRMNLVYRDLVNVSTDDSAIIWPLKEIRTQEVTTYLDLFFSTDSDLQLGSSEIPAQGPAKSLSIDALLRSYFAEIESAFPSVATTVVRTVEKLADPSTCSPHILEKLSSSSSAASPFASVPQYGSCAVCGCAREAKVSEWIKKITVNEGVQEDEVTTIELPEAIQESSSIDSLCYGCIVMLKDSSISTLPDWTAPRASLSSVLSEYEL
ncbi:uncharacterized protein SAPINGB_P004137 [Magnusiomyces paraingens]|uniref:Cytoplasmic tRNA 2-thiolation protein 2 n=1 Tax=Magnusiomyces paraingens TaxID=2606893 RepID=A0A5E8BTY3_9ASCO|nr:uncharacterized protein SAPINGB_P004137 [Saprochaete ingens]VVT54561.1 unnamed protein product [Saprochaete ingens]